MDTHKLLAEQFETSRAHLRAVAYRMLGSFSEADDAIQEAWLRLNRSDSSSIENLGGWLTTVIARVCLDMLRARTSRREESLGMHMPDSFVSAEEESDPEHEMLLADSVGLALLVVLDTLAPAERLAFVLHDVFAVPFDEIAPIVERSPEATRKLASRARRRVRGVEAVPDADFARQRAVIDAFLAASREGNFEALLVLLDPEVVLRADRAAVSLGGPEELRGATAVAKQFLGRARKAQPALIDGVLGVVIAPGGRVRLVLGLTMTHEKIVAIEVVADPARLQRLDVAVLGDLTGS